MTHYFLIQTSIPENCWLVHFQRGLIKRFNLEGKIKFSKRLKKSKCNCCTAAKWKVSFIVQCGRAGGAPVLPPISEAKYFST